jgi:hypothetical protein
VVVQVHSSGPLHTKARVPSSSPARMEGGKRKERRRLFARTCLCTAARAAVVAAVVKPEWARVERRENN